MTSMMRWEVGILPSQMAVVCDVARSEFFDILTAEIAELFSLTH